MAMSSKSNPLDNIPHGAPLISHRLSQFRSWLTNDVGAKIHPSICIVNGEANDGTKNAPILLYGSATTNPSEEPQGNSDSQSKDSNNRCGMIDSDLDRMLWDRTMGCQVRTVREMKKGETMLDIPKSGMVTPKLIACSDAGRAVLSCCESDSTMEEDSILWETLGTTRELLSNQMNKIKHQSGTQLLVTILRERKKAEDLLSKALSKSTAEMKFSAASKGSVSSRAPYLAFLLHQRFAPNPNPPVVDPYRDVRRVDPNDEHNKDLLISGNNASSIPMGPSPPFNSPRTFSLYANTLPPATSIPICWKRNELAYLAGCLSGLTTLQEVAAHTLVLSNDLTLLVQAGILHQFADLFPKGSITWDHWVWAASVLMSRSLNSDLFYGDYPSDSKNTVAAWEDVGILVPFLDMLNHERASSQIDWVLPVADEETQPHALVLKRVKKGCQVYRFYAPNSSPGVHVDGSPEPILTNQIMIMNYGFAQIGNPSDEMAIAWGLCNGVGNIPSLSEYDFLMVKGDAPAEVSGKKKKNVGVNGVPIQSVFYTDLDKLKKTNLVFESTDAILMNKWWSKDRLGLLEHFIKNVDSTVYATLVSGKKSKVMTYVEDGMYHDELITCAVIATLPRKKVNEHTDLLNSPDFKMTITKRHQQILRHYLQFFFTRKIEKLLHNINLGLKDHFQTAELWTHASHGGLYYKHDPATPNPSNPNNVEYVGWQTFFDAHAYTATMEVEKGGYYAMGADSCVLTLYDSNLRCLQSSMDGLVEDEKFVKVLNQLEKLGFLIGTEEDEIEEDEEMLDVAAVTTEQAKADVETDVNSSTENSIPKEIKSEKPESPSTATSKDNIPKKQSNGEQKQNQNKDQNKAPQSSTTKPNSNTPNNNQRERDRNRRRNRNRNNTPPNNPNAPQRPPAIKLHVGNLSYTTMPSQLFSFFANMYGQDNVLECHIPTERDTGKSRGFGFVTMPEATAFKVLDRADIPHEIEGRVLKVARSNTAGSVSKNPNNSVGQHNIHLHLPPNGPPMGHMVNDRCNNCGYRPRYCNCNNKPMNGPPLHFDEYRNGPPHARFMDHGPNNPDRLRGNFGNNPIRDRMARQGSQHSYSNSPPRQFGPGGPHMHGYPRMGGGMQDRPPGAMNPPNHYRGHEFDRRKPMRDDVDERGRNYREHSRERRGRRHNFSRSRSRSRSRSYSKDSRDHSRSRSRRKHRSSRSSRRSRRSRRSRSKSWDRSRSRSRERRYRDRDRRGSSNSKSRSRSRERKDLNERSRSDDSAGNLPKEGNLVLGEMEKKNRKSSRASRSRSRSKGSRSRRKRRRSHTRSRSRSPRSRSRSPNRRGGSRSPRSRSRSRSPTRRGGSRSRSRSI